MNDPAQMYYDKSRMAKGEVVDFDLRGLPVNADESIVKQVAGVKHIIETAVKHDTFTGECKGEARIKIRLAQGETEE
jgi:hypothetical protein